MVEVESAHEALLETEDTTGTFQITIEDNGPKVKDIREQF
jgi:anti-sigma regulatory factor (Ser/Thr protein kinase)